MDWTVSQIKAMAPDASSFLAGEKLSRSTWQKTGCSERALWGEIKGSGVNPYQVRIDLVDFAYRCSCPSRKLPCKHVLALLLLIADNAAKVPQAEEPEGVQEWLQGRAERAEKKERKRQEEEKTVSEENGLGTQSSPEKSSPSPSVQKTSNKRVQEREKRVSEGVDQLSLWLEDIMRSGIVTLNQQPLSFWEEEARRMIDAQAPGLALRVQAISNLPDTSSQWPEIVYGELGRLTLLLEAWKKRERFNDNFQSELRQTLGWTISKEEVALSSDCCSDRWVLMGQSFNETSKLKTQRNWYLGLKSNRYCLYLQFAIGNTGFSEPLFPGSFREGEVAFWPGTSRIRGLFKSNQSPSVKNIILPDTSTETIPDFLIRYSDELVRWPWLDRSPVLLKDVFVRPIDSAGLSWHLFDGNGNVLPVSGRDYWQLAAITYRQPLPIFGEWNGRKFKPLAVWYNGIFQFSLVTEV